MFYSLCAHGFENFGWVAIIAWCFVIFQVTNSFHKFLSEDFLIGLLEITNCGIDAITIALGDTLKSVPVGKELSMPLHFTLKNT